ncbi:hypothetical protein A7P54_07090 [Acinetobacter sp. Ac_3412]|uniref:TniB family NTP-binding protein n=1 Tax=Acinetobacter sp. Ac_3412 TaxID=1848935 RepID=UPI0014900076|nr:TniB family NTP-binding protein [Acinetobacter sp. Ac_3412]NNP76182.1 hypothetical protein [Acinetobacter sp. Ac_3412]
MSDISDFIKINADRIQKIESIFIKYPRVTEILNSIEECREMSKLSDEPQCMFITGGSGVGKTSLIRQYSDRWPPIEMPDGDILPVFKTSIPASATIKSVATAMLSDLGDLAATHGTTVIQSNRLYSLVHQCKVELIIIDEFQHLIDNKTQRVIGLVADWIKMFIEITKIPVILIGMPESETILNQSPQLRRRFLIKKRLTPFLWDSEVNRNEFRKFLAEVDKSLPFDKYSNLASEEIAYRLFVASKGTAANIMALIKRASYDAFRHNDSSLALHHFANAFESIQYDTTLPNNPFLVEIDVISSWKATSLITQSEIGTNNRVKAKAKELTIRNTITRR